MVFCATVCAMSVGGAVERGRIVALVPFIFVSQERPRVSYVSSIFSYGLHLCTGKYKRAKK